MLSAGERARGQLDASENRLRHLAKIDRGAEQILHALQVEDANRHNTVERQGYKRKRRGMRRVAVVDRTEVSRRAAVSLRELERLRAPPTPWLTKLISYLLSGSVD